MIAALGKVFSLRTRLIPLDVDFIDEKNGFLVGSNRLIMESNDGGETWEKRNLDLPSEENFRLLDLSLIHI